ncbi:MAG: helix-turn-helix transcriptional regulator [Bacilli bacterium]|jgi:transcriptional regulator with XRE-family HTH domain|nr:helix-turn-helix transcriptional regulator [Bacilli bacterium]
MDITEKIKVLMTERGWSVYQLSKESTLTASTLTNMFKRHSQPSIKTVKSVAEAFGISVSELLGEGPVDENGKVLSPIESQIISDYRKLDPEAKSLFFSLLDLYTSKKH